MHSARRKDEVILPEHVGILDDVALSLSFCPEEFFRKELVIFGTQILPFTYSRALQLASIMPKSYLDLKSLGVEVFALSEYKEALEKLERGSISKAIFRITE